jgi:hypothetical protein
MVKKLRRAGYQVKEDGNDHYRVTDAKGRYLATFPKTTRNWRWLANLRTAMKRREREYAEQEQSA